MAHSLKPKKIRRVHASRETSVQGWFYENAKSIEVYLRDNTGKLTITGRIPRAQLADWLKRTETPTQDNGQ